ncbi:MAG: leucine-rich repeat domain-containing protein [Clostridiales bacterium]|nr:leucine-rich repeat domain-containing protein [Clostridiales bacterium]
MKTKNKPPMKTTEELMREIPESDIWTYRIEGLQEPQINRDHSHSAGKKAATVISLLVAISLSIFFSVRAVHTKTYKFGENDDGTYELIKFSNPGNMSGIDIDFANGDETKPITVIHEYAFNCDDKLETIRIGKDVKEIDGKSFYSCEKLQAFSVDENNEYFCDLDGVLYTKDLSEVICYPIGRDQYLRDKFGYEKELTNEDDGYEAYEKDVLTYRLPEQVKKIGKLSFNYAKIADIYLPEGLETIETMAFFKSVTLKNVITVGKDGEYPSLPEGLLYIGSDAFSYDQGLGYVYIPSSVTFIGHHAFWDTVYKQSGELAGVTAICVAADKDTFKEQVHTGDQWKPEYDYMLFKKAVEVLYSSERESS